MVWTSKLNQKSVEAYARPSRSTGKEVRIINRIAKGYDQPVPLFNRRLTYGTLKVSLQPAIQPNTKYKLINTL